MKKQQNSIPSCIQYLNSHPEHLNHGCTALCWLEAEAAIEDAIISLNLYYHDEVSRMYEGQIRE